MLAGERKCQGGERLDGAVGWRMAAAACAQIIKFAAFFEHRLQEGSKAIFHIEAFVARVMAIYKKWSASMFGGAA